MTDCKVRFQSMLQLKRDNCCFQTPSAGQSSVTITATSVTKRAMNVGNDDDDDDAKKRSRSCKGRRYQEFKDAVGRKGRKSHRSGDSRQVLEIFPEKFMVMVCEIVPEIASEGVDN